MGLPADKISAFCVNPDIRAIERLGAREIAESSTVTIDIGAGFDEWTRELARLLRPSLLERVFGENLLSRELEVADVAQIVEDYLEDCAHKVALVQKHVNRLEILLCLARVLTDELQTRWTHNAGSQRAVEASFERRLALTSHLTVMKQLLTAAKLTQANTIKLTEAAKTLRLARRTRDAVRKVS